MIIIYGRKVVRSIHPSSDAILGSNAPCPMRNCRGVCKVYVAQLYCHMYFIPCFPQGEEKEMVQCTRCKTSFQVNAYKQWRERAQRIPADIMVNLLVGSDPNKKPEEAAKEWLQKGQFDKAAFVAKNGLSRDSQNINLMCHLGVALNGVGKAKESDKLAGTIVYHWETHCRAQWIAKGRLEASAAFPRVSLKEGLPSVRIEGKQYFEPQPLDGGKLAHYKVIIYFSEDEAKTAPTANKMRRGVAYSSLPSDDKRIFKLVKAPNGSYSLQEFTPNSVDAIDAIFYRGEEKEQPDIRKVTSDVASFLAGEGIVMENASGRREMICDGHTDFRFFDPCETDPRFSRMQIFRANADWMAVRDFFGTLKQEEESFWIRQLTKDIGTTWSKKELGGKMSPMLDEWLAAEPSSELCRLVRLNTYISWAWNARTAQLARAVSKERHAQFHKRLLEAAAEFKASKDICSRSPVLYSVGMTIARGLRFSKAEDIPTMDECRAGLRDLSSDPFDVTAHSGALQNYCRKWGGSHEQMFDYARSITAGVPDGHPLWVLIPMAHCERVLIQRVNGYWQRPDVKKEILEAYHRAFPSGVASTVTIAPHQLSPEWTCRNYFAYCMIMTGHYEEARHQMRVIGKRPLQNLWGDYRYYLLLLGFDLEGGDTGSATASWESADHETDAPLAQAEVIEGAEAQTIPVAEAQILPEIV